MPYRNGARRRRWRAAVRESRSSARHSAGGSCRSRREGRTTVAWPGGLQRLPQIVGLGIAKEWAFSGRRIGAEKAYRTGLANHVCPVDQLLAEAMTLTRLEAVTIATLFILFVSILVGVIDR